MADAILGQERPGGGQDEEEEEEEEKRRRIYREWKIKHKLCECVCLKLGKISFKRLERTVVKVEKRRIIMVGEWVNGCVNGSSRRVPSFFEGRD